ncbi:MAG: YceI family protein [Bacteroidota bacterium]
MKKIILSLVGAAIGFTASAQSKWNVDPTHSNVKFSVSHMVISEVEGSFTGFDGTLDAPGADFNNATINFSVNIGTINTNSEQRDGHLKSADFFDAAKYPTMTFKSTSFKKTTGNNYQLVGNLTIKGVTKKVTFDVTYGGTVKDPYGNIKAGFKAKSSIKRMEYGLTWSTLTEAGGMVVGDDVAILLNIELAKAK